MFEEREQKVILNIRVTPTERESLKRFAESKNMSVTKLIKVALIKYIEDSKKINKIPEIFWNE